MKNIKTFKAFSINENVQKSKEEIVSEFSSKYGEEWFGKFLEVFPTEEIFKRTLPDYTDYDHDEEYEDEDDAWSAEAEVNMLEQEVGSYPGDDIWVEFHNALCNTNWCM